MDRSEFEESVVKEFLGYACFDRDGKLDLQYGCAPDLDALPLGDAVPAYLRTIGSDVRLYSASTPGDNVALNIFRHSLYRLAELCERKGQPDRLLEGKFGELPGQLEFRVLDFGYDASVVLRCSLDDDCYRTELVLEHSVHGVENRRYIRPDGRTKVFPQSEAIVRHLQNPEKARQKKNSSRRLRIVPEDWERDVQ